eukprot:6198335-Pleurochrysis_carterae.AAC.1
MIAENGIADATDVLRAAYITEHLAAVGALRAHGERPAQRTSVRARRHARAYTLTRARVHVRTR